MPLNDQQVEDLRESINGYAFPTEYFDFVNCRRAIAPNIVVLEETIREMLHSPQCQQTLYGLANVLYWGYANAGFRRYRVNQFINNVACDQLAQFQGIVENGNLPTLEDIRDMRMPQFSGISFISKIIAFLDPENYCVLDLKLSRLGWVGENKALHGLRVNSQIRVTANNSAVYYRWCRECRDLNDRYYNGQYRAVDIERGFFTLIQNRRLNDARQIYSDA